MKLLLPFGLVALAAVALAQDTSPTIIGAQDCTAQNPCAVTRNSSSDVWVAAHSNPPGTSPALPAPGNGSHNQFTHTYEGPEILSLEETAVYYFQDVASSDAAYWGAGKPFDPRNVMWDRGDELTDAEAAEVLEVARHAASTEQQTSDERFKVERRRMCDEFNNAVTTDAQVAVLQNSDARSVAQRKADGTALLEQLSPGARERLNSVLIRHRASIGVGRLDWAEIAKAHPESLQMMHARMCTQ